MSRPHKLPILAVKDLADPGSGRLEDVCRKYGAFYIQDDGILSGHVRSVGKEAADFFAQSEDRKARHIATPENHFVGYRPLGSEASMLEDQKENCEQYKIGYLKQGGQNSRDTATERLSDACFEGGATLAYWLAAQRMSDAIIASLGEVLSLGSEYFASCCSQPMHQLGLNRYPCVADKPVISMSAHKDLCLLTLVAQEYAGLEIQVDNGDYELAEPIPGTVVCMLGEYMHRWSGGSFVAPMHRVRGSARVSRISIIYKHRPNYDAVIQTPLFCQDLDKFIEQNYQTGLSYEKKIFNIMGSGQADTAIGR